MNPPNDPTRSPVAPDNTRPNTDPQNSFSAAQQLYSRSQAHFYPSMPMALFYPGYDASGHVHQPPPFSFDYQHPYYFQPQQIPMQYQDLQQPSNFQQHPSTIAYDQVEVSEQSDDTSCWRNYQNHWTVFDVMSGQVNYIRIQIEENPSEYFHTNFNSSSNSPESSYNSTEDSNEAPEHRQQKRNAQSPQRNPESLAEFAELHARQDPLDYFHINSPESSSNLTGASNRSPETRQEERNAQSPQRNLEDLAEFAELHARQDPVMHPVIVDVNNFNEIQEA
ncbi:uncharacterized protein LOC143470089 [Clavelina lepadiformis]|uniref:uncharacterized protein LOC143470089 n=1 Tax=Clavelina lepadiformis TaxID=159417 RepID=UPI00404164FB